MTTDEKLAWMEKKLTHTFNAISVLRTTPNKITPHALKAIMRLATEVHDTAQIINDEMYGVRNLETYLLKMGGTSV